MKVSLLNAYYNRFHFLQALADDLKDELSGDFEEAVLALLDDPRELDARMLHAAIAVHPTLDKSKSRGFSEILRYIRTSTNQSCRIKEKINRTTTFYK